MLSFTPDAQPAANNPLLAHGTRLGNIMNSTSTCLHIFYIYIYTYIQYTYVYIIIIVSHYFFAGLLYGKLPDSCGSGSRLISLLLRLDCFVQMEYLSAWMTCSLWYVVKFISKSIGLLKLFSWLKVNVTPSCKTIAYHDNLAFLVIINGTFSADTSLWSVHSKLK